MHCTKAAAGLANSEHIHNALNVRRYHLCKIWFALWQILFIGRSIKHNDYAMCSTRTRTWITENQYISISMEKSTNMCKDHIDIVFSLGVRHVCSSFFSTKSVQMQKHVRFFLWAWFTEHVTPNNTNHWISNLSYSSSLKPFWFMAKQSLFSSQHHSFQVWSVILQTSGSNAKILMFMYNVCKIQ